jgi:hypothetical protein
VATNPGHQTSQRFNSTTAAFRRGNENSLLTHRNPPTSLSEHLSPSSCQGSVFQLVPTARSDGAGAVVLLCRCMPLCRWLLLCSPPHLTTLRVAYVKSCLSEPHHASQRAALHQTYGLRSAFSASPGGCHCHWPCRNRCRVSHLRCRQHVAMLRLTQARCCTLYNLLILPYANSAPASKSPRHSDESCTIAHGDHHVFDSDHFQIHRNCMLWMHS